MQSLASLMSYQQGDVGNMEDIWDSMEEEPEEWRGRSPGPGHTPTADNAHSARTGRWWWWCVCVGGGGLLQTGSDSKLGEQSSSEEAAGEEKVRSRQKEPYS